LPSNKDKVTSYLEIDEFEALKEFRDSQGLSNSEAVSLLIRDRLIKQDESPDWVIRLPELESKVEFLELELDVTNKTRLSVCEKTEKLEEQISCLQEMIDRLRREVERSSVDWLSDEQVASYVGAREETVREWRLGLRKPRGSNICSLLEEFQLDFGRWRRKG